MSNKINKKVPDALWHPGLLWLLPRRGLSMRGVAFRQAVILSSLYHYWDEAMFLTPTQRDSMVCLCPACIPTLFQAVITDPAFEPAESSLSTNGRLKLCPGLSDRKTADKVRHDAVVVDLIPGRERKNPAGAVFRKFREGFICQPRDKRVWEADRLSGLPVIIIGKRVIAASSAWMTCANSILGPISGLSPSALLVFFCCRMVTGYYAPL